MLLHSTDLAPDGQSPYLPNYVHLSIQEMARIKARQWLVLD